ncbi:hypothetical protein [Sabulicella rubraurantiaca]|uniref:hypothetical protein n=1 Tax=Sabulicella rubraurantiaca TaxID=2811429 RepID=UPI001A96A667|nr:hypothetical protein [Sabulicella rubraurantiaca]
MIGADLPLGWLATLLRFLPPKLIAAMALVPVAVTVWLALRKNARSEDEHESKMREQLDASAQRIFDRLNGELGRLAKHCDDLDAKLEEIRERLRAEQDRTHRLRHDRNDLRQRITALHA